MGDAVLLFLSIFSVVVVYVGIQIVKRGNAFLDKVAEKEIRGHRDQYSVEGKIKLVETRSSTPKDIMCPLCQDAIDSGVRLCNHCGALYHWDCLEELSAGRCATLGCKRQLVQLKS